LPTYEGRLELTWTNKPLRLLAHEDGSYQWVPPSDYRVAEVRLLHAARRWANYVSGDETVAACWRYLLVSETDVKTAKGSWEALKGLGGP